VPAVQVTVAAEGAKPMSHRTVQLPPLGMLVPQARVPPVMLPGGTEHGSPVPVTIQQIECNTF
jgi:hypothetical protein